MLVLSRKKDESIVINNDITIVVVEIRGDKVRLGVEAPKEVPVHRREVFDAIARGESVDSGVNVAACGTSVAAASGPATGRSDANMPVDKGQPGDISVPTSEPRTSEQVTSKPVPKA